MKDDGDRIDAKHETRADIDALSDEQYARRNEPVKLVSDDGGNYAEYRLKTIDSKWVQAVHEARRKEHIEGGAMIAYSANDIREFTVDNIPPPRGMQAEPPPNSSFFRPGVTPMWQGSAWTRKRRSQDELFSPSLSQRRAATLGSEFDAPNRLLNDDEPTLQVLINPPADSRVWRTHAFTGWWPDCTSMALYKQESSYYASATSIGAYTAISVAHGFYERDANDGPVGWLVKPNLMVSRVSHYTASNGTITTTGSPQYPGSCYTVTIPANFVNGGAGDDFAILDFYSCSFHPGASWCSMTPAYSNSPSSYSLPVYMTAYDGESISTVGNTNSLPSGQFYNLPSMIYRSAPQPNSGYSYGMNVLFSAPWTITHWMDITKGSSGGGMLATILGPSYGLTWVGNHYGQSTPGSTPRENYGRTLTAGSWGFIQQWSTEF
ncbi:MAG: hypothetical protein U0270_42020 [Labilithrix sp.]